MLDIRTEMEGDEFEWSLSENLIKMDCEGCDRKILIGDAVWYVYGINESGRPVVAPIHYCGRCASGFLHDVTSTEVYPNADTPVRGDGEIGFFNDTWLEYPHPNAWRYDLYDEATGRTAPITKRNVELLRPGQALAQGTYLYRLDSITRYQDDGPTYYMGFVLNDKGEGDELRLNLDQLPD